MSNPQDVQLTVVSGGVVEIATTSGNVVELTIPVTEETFFLNLGVPGVQGPVGINTVPSGGVAGQIMVKNSSIDYDIVWTSSFNGIADDGTF
jgi:hypothetical protein